MMADPKYNIELINPDHYKQGTIECIDYIRDRLGYDSFKAYLLGSHYKYTYRFSYKHKHLDPLSRKKEEDRDLRKAMWYLCRYQDLLKKEIEAHEEVDNRQEIEYSAGDIPSDTEQK